MSRRPRPDDPPRRSYVRRAVPGNPVRWTPEQDETILDMRNAGLSYKEIARRTSKSRNAIIGRLHRLGYDDDDGSQIITMEDRLRAGVNFPPRGRCVWPYGNVGESGFHFCGARVFDLVEASYCAEHHAVAWVRPRNWR